MTMKIEEMVTTGRFLGEEFLTWLWYKGLTDGGLSGVDGDMTACFVDDAVILVSERGDVKELSLRKGNPAESREAFEALARGMRLSKAKIRLLSGDMEWVTMMDAATLATSAMKLPSSQAKDPMGRVADRLFLIEEGLNHLQRRYRAFLTIRTEAQDEFKQNIDAWIQRGLDSLLNEDTDTDS